MYIFNNSTKNVRIIEVSHVTQKNKVSHITQKANSAFDFSITIKNNRNIFESVT